MNREMLLESILGVILFVTLSIVILVIMTIILFVRVVLISMAVTSIVKAKLEIHFFSCHPMIAGEIEKFC